MRLRKSGEKELMQTVQRVGERVRESQKNSDLRTAQSSEARE